MAKRACHTREVVITPRIIFVGGQFVYQVDKLIVGPLSTNCFLVWPVAEGTCELNPALVIDPGGDPQQIGGAIERYRLKPLALVCTHAHPDHTAGASWLRDHYQVPVLIGELDAEDLGNPLFQLPGLESPPVEAEGELAAGDTLECGQLVFEVLHTPGHTPGSICLYCQDALVCFTGDTLLAGSVGRTDLPGGSQEQLVTSLRRLRSYLDPRTRIYPGHGPETSLAAEQRTNPFLVSR